MSPDEEPSESPGGDVICMPCRGNGSVLAKRGEEMVTVECPWCEGAGKPIPEHDAQAKKKAERGEGPQPPDAAA